MRKRDTIRLAIVRYVHLHPGCSSLVIAHAVGLKRVSSRVIPHIAHLEAAGIIRSEWADEEPPRRRLYYCTHEECS